MFFKAIASKKPLYTVDPLRLNPDLYVQAAFIEI